MSEDQADYLAEQGYVAEAVAMLGAGYNDQKAAIIERPRTVHTVGDVGLEESRLFGWVKMSAKFCPHIKKLRGAKLSIWLCLALNIDENGECKLTQKELCAMTGYSHTEVIDSVSELNVMGFLAVDRSGKKNLYKPVFVARGKGNNPLVKKLDSTPADSLESSPAYKNSVPTSSKKEQEENERYSAVAKKLSELQGGGLNSMDADMISVWLEKHTNEWIFRAIDEARAHGARSSKYVDRVLVGWEANEYPKTREQQVKERKVYTPNAKALDIDAILGLS